MFKNDNGQNYRILKSTGIGKPALLVSCDDEPFGFIVVSILEKSSWSHGEYFNNLDEALAEYEDKA